MYASLPVEQTNQTILISAMYLLPITDTCMWVCGGCISSRRCRKYQENRLPVEELQGQPAGARLVFLNDVLAVRKQQRAINKYVYM